MDLKPGDAVDIPKGTINLLPSGNLLDKNTIKETKMEHGALGKIYGFSEKICAVVIWIEGGKNPSVVNIPKKCWGFLRKSKMILRWDMNTKTTQVFDPDNLPQEGSRIYEIFSSNNTTFCTSATWARDRNRAIEISKAEWPYGKRHGAHLKYKNQVPLRHADVLKSK